LSPSAVVPGNSCSPPRFPGFPDEGFPEMSFEPIHDGIPRILPRHLQTSFAGLSIRLGHSLPAQFHEFAGSASDFYHRTEIANNVRHLSADDWAAGGHVFQGLGRIDEFRRFIESKGHQTGIETFA